MNYGRVLTAVLGRPVRARSERPERCLARLCLECSHLYDAAELQFLTQVVAGKKLTAAERHQLTDLAVRAVIASGPPPGGAR